MQPSAEACLPLLRRLCLRIDQERPDSNDYAYASLPVEFDKLARPKKQLLPMQL